MLKELTADFSLIFSHIHALSYREIMAIVFRLFVMKYAFWGTLSKKQWFLENVYIMFLCPYSALASQTFTSGSTRKLCNVC